MADMRLSKIDWQLILDALEMLSADYQERGGHPDKSRLEALKDYALSKLPSKEN